MFHPSQIIPKKFAIKYFPYNESFSHECCNKELWAPEFNKSRLESWFYNLVAM